MVAGFARPAPIILLVAALFAGHSPAATITVANLGDSGPGSLRDAIASAASGDTITFGSLSGNLSLTSSSLLAYGRTAFNIDKSLTILGNGNVSLVFGGTGTTAANSFRAFTIQSGSALTLRDMSINGFVNRGGNGGNPGGRSAGGGGGLGAGGAIFVAQGTLDVARLTFTANSAIGGAGTGGASSSTGGGGAGGGGMGGDGGGGSSSSTNGNSGGVGGGLNGGAAGSSGGASGGIGGGAGGANGSSNSISAVGGFGGGGGAPGNGASRSGGTGGFGGGAGGGGATSRPTGGTIFGGGNGGSSGTGGGAGMGGAIFLLGARATIVDSIFTGNAGTAGANGGSTSNPPLGLGGAIFNLASELTFQQLTFTSNTASSSGADIYSYGTTFGTVGVPTLTRYTAENSYSGSQGTIAETGTVTWTVLTVPEPSLFAAGLLAVAGLVACRRRRFWYTSGFRSVDP